jgi:hypothetical protein
LLGHVLNDNILLDAIRLASLASRGQIAGNSSFEATVTDARYVSLIEIEEDAKDRRGGQQSPVSKTRSSAAGRR